jgi:hypothetical protein
VLKKRNKGFGTKNILFKKIKILTLPSRGTMTASLGQLVTRQLALPVLTALLVFLVLLSAQHVRAEGQGLAGAGGTFFSVRTIRPQGIIKF